MTGEQISQSLNGATKANVLIEPGAGDLRVGSQRQADILIKGTVPAEGVNSIKSSYTVSNGTGNYTLRGMEGTVFLPSTNLNKWTWSLNLTDQVPLDLVLGIGAGNIDADLRELDLDSLQVKMGVGNSTVVLPQVGNLDAQVEGAIGQLNIQVPEGMEVLVRTDTALSGVSVPEGYVRTGDVYKSPGYDQAEERTNLSLNLAIGSVVIQEAP